MKKLKKMSELESQYEKSMLDELDDYKREREIIFDETLDAKEAFAKGLKDEFGEEILRELKKAPVKMPEVQEKKPSKIKLFFKRLFEVL